MKLVRYGAPGREKPGIIDADGKIRDLSRIVPDIDGAMLAAGGLAKIKKANLKRLKTVGGKPRLGPCVGHVRNYLAIGLNYSDHAAEGGNPIPKEPVVFNKAPSCICGPNDNTMIPKNSTKLDYECELGVIIGKRARYLAKEKAMDVIAGRKLPLDVMVVIAASENMPGASAQRPGDVVMSADGKTVEILNTDAEGRLVLADAITHALRNGATHILDLATLTGAAAVAIGHAATAAVSNDDAF